VAAFNASDFVTLLFQNFHQAGERIAVILNDQDAGHSVTSFV
jgi:hypothetical protein